MNIDWLQWYGAMHCMNILKIAEAEIIAHRKTIEGLLWVDDVVGWRCDALLFDNAGNLDSELL